MPPSQSAAEVVTLPGLSPPARLAVFAVVLAVVFAVGLVLGAMVGPEPSPAPPAEPVVDHPEGHR